MVPVDREIPTWSAAPWIVLTLLLFLELPLRFYGAKPGGEGALLPSGEGGQCGEGRSPASFPSHLPCGVLSTPE